ncbi:MAG: hypothetical protein JST53_11625 [Actinobacteria bacterium]|nr:hypothetical protein [Actinomycetota bacterium]
MRIRWRGVARVAAIAVVGLVALRLVPALLHAPEPPPIPANVGLPRAKPAAREPEPPLRVPKPPVRPKPTKPHRHPVPDEPAARAKIGTRTRQHRRHRTRDRSEPRTARHHRLTPPKPVDSSPNPVEPAPPPAPEYVPPPAAEPEPEAVPTPLPEAPPAPRSVPGDGSQEFAPH